MTLTTPVHDGDRVAVVASKGGENPDLDRYRNLVADPSGDVGTCGATFAMGARTPTPEERAVPWRETVQASNGCAGYTRCLARDMPAVTCEQRWE